MGFEIWAEAFYLPSRYCFLNSIYSKYVCMYICIRLVMCSRNIPATPMDITLLAEEGFSQERAPVS